MTGFREDKLYLDIYMWRLYRDHLIVFHHPHTPCQDLNPKQLQLRSDDFRDYVVSLLPGWHVGQFNASELDRGRRVQDLSWKTRSFW